MITPSKIASIISEDIDDGVDVGSRTSIDQYLSEIGKHVPIDGMSTMEDTFEEIEIGPYSIHIEADVAYSYQAGEPMVRYYSDGSGYPGSPDELDAYLAGINEINVYNEDGDSICSWTKTTQDGDCSVVTPDLVAQIEKVVNQMIEGKKEDYMRDISEGNADDEDAYREMEADSRRDDRYFESSNSLNHLKLIVDSDPALFESMLSKSGFKVIGKRDCDPLRKSVQSESVQSIASLISESKDENPKVSGMAKLADSLGYIVESSGKIMYRGFEISPLDYGYYGWVHPDYYDADIADGGESFQGNEFAGTAKDVEDAKNQIDDLVDEIGQTDPDYAGEFGDRDLENAFPGGPTNPGPNYDGREARGGMSGSFHNKAVEEG